MSQGNVVPRPRTTPSPAGSLRPWRSLGTSAGLTGPGSPSWRAGPPLCGLARKAAAGRNLSEQSLGLARLRAPAPTPLSAVRARLPQKALLGAVCRRLRGLFRTQPGKRNPGLGAVKLLGRRLEGALPKGLCSSAGRGGKLSPPRSGEGIAEAARGTFPRGLPGRAPEPRQRRRGSAGRPGRVPARSRPKRRLCLPAVLTPFRARPLPFPCLYQEPGCAQPGPLPSVRGGSPGAQGRQRSGLRKGKACVHSRALRPRQPPGKLGYSGQALEAALGGLGVGTGSVVFPA